MEQVQQHLIAPANIIDINMHANTGHLINMILLS